MRYIISAVTDVGLRRTVNQDALFVRKFAARTGEVVFAVLCDGMGGLAQGETASATVLNEFTKWQNSNLAELTRVTFETSELTEQWRAVIAGLHSMIRNYGAGLNIQLGATLTALLLTQQNYYAVNVGDSRAYEISGGVRQITRDHSLVAQKVYNGELTEQEAALAPDQHILTQCIGSGGAAVAPDFFSDKILPNSTFMLCSDGFRHKVRAEEFSKYLNPNAITNKRQLRRKEKLLIDLNKRRGENDNISVITIVCKRE